MKSQLTLTSIALGLTLSTGWAQETSVTSTTELSDNPFIVEMNTEHTQRSNSFRNISNKLMPEFGYKVLPETKVSVFTEFEARRGKDAQFSSLVPRIQHQIFTNAENELDFGVDVRYYSFLKGTDKASEKANGKFNVRTSAVKELDSNFKLTNKNKLYFYNTDEKWSKASEKWHQTYNHEFRLLGTYTVEKFTTELEFKYVSLSGENSRNKYNQVSHYKSYGYLGDKDRVQAHGNYWNTSETFYVIPRAIYAVNESLKVELAMSADIFQSHDRKTLARTSLVAEPKISYTYNKNISGELMAKIPAILKAGETIANQSSIELDLKLAAF